MKPASHSKNQRTMSFTRDGAVGSNQKVRYPSQSSEAISSSGAQHVVSDDGSNPLKRRNIDTSVDYPRRRATIAV